MRARIMRGARRRRVHCRMFAGAGERIVDLLCPTLSVFEASKYSGIAENEVVTLSWVVRNAPTIELRAGTGAWENVTTLTGDDGNGSKDVTVTASIVYTLRATCGSNVITRAFGLALSGDPPLISAFGASPEVVDVGGTVLLEWFVTAADRFSIDQDVGNVTGSSFTVTPPAGTTVYTLTATNDDGSSTATATVRAGDAPSITSFTADDDTVTSGTTVTLTWAVTDATSLVLGDTTVTGTSTTVTPTATTTYTLTATNDFGTDTEEEVVEVGVVPTITSFTADDASIISGASTTLRWVTTGATTFSIDQSVGVVTGTDVSVTPTETTTYTLTATNDFGAVTSTATVTVTVIARDTSAEIDLLDVSSALTEPRGLWGTATRFYVANAAPQAINIYRINRSTGALVGIWPTGAVVTAPAGLWGDGTHLWVVGHNNSEIVPFRLSDGGAVVGQVLRLAFGSGQNRSARGLWGNSTHFWVLNNGDGTPDQGPRKIFVYARSNGARASSMDIDLVAENAAPYGIWSDGTTMWVSDRAADKYFAYMLSSGVRNSANEFDLHHLNRRPFGTWGDGEHLFNVDPLEDHLYAYAWSD